MSERSLDNSVGEIWEVSPVPDLAGSVFCSFPVLEEASFAGVEIFPRSSFDFFSASLDDFSAAPPSVLLGLAVPRGVIDVLKLADSFSAGDPRSSPVSDFKLSPPSFNFSFPALISFSPFSFIPWKTSFIFSLNFDFFASAPASLDPRFVFLILPRFLFLCLMKSPQFFQIPLLPSYFL